MNLYNWPSFDVYFETKKGGDTAAVLKSQSLEVEPSARLLLIFKLFCQLIVHLFKQFAKGR